MSRSTRLRWTPESQSTQRNCQNCDTQVTKQFARVFGDNRDVVHHCPDCEHIAFRDMKWGAGTDPDYSRDDRGQCASDANPLFRGEDA